MIDPALIARFRADLERLLARPLGSDERLGIAVSGGPDSMALLHLAHSAYRNRIYAATIDHRIRAESAEEAAMVAAFCAARGIPHATLAPDAAPEGSSLQARARDARYAQLARWAENAGIALVCTAHHLDDQAETLLMRALRGSGLAGLSGIRPVNTRWAPVTILRPLLNWRREELFVLATENQLPFITDHSNADQRFDRTRIRVLLTTHPWIDPARLAASAGHLAEARDALDFASEAAWRERASESDAALILDAAGLPAALRRALTVRALATLDAPTPDGPALTRLLVTLSTGGTATLAGIRCAARGDRWTFTPAPPRRTG